MANQRAIDAINRVSVPDGGGYIPPSINYSSEPGLLSSTFGTFKNEILYWATGFDENCSMAYETALNSPGAEVNGRMYRPLPEVGRMNTEPSFFSCIFTA